MEKLYEMLLGCPPAQDAEALPRRAPGWDAADGAGPDRLFNRYRRLRLDARAAPADVTARCPAGPSAGRA
jgi:hypothetical protein